MSRCAAQDLPQAVLAEREAAADDLLDLLLEFRRDRAQQVLTEARAAAAAGARPGALLQLRQRVDAELVDRVDDGALGHADAAADGGALRHFGDVESGIGGRRREQQMPPLRGEVGIGPQPLHVAVAVGGVADEDDARQPAVADRQLLVDADGAIFVADRLGVLLAPVARREDVDTHDLELGGLHRAGVGRAPVAGDRGRQHLALLEQRRDEPVTDAAMLHALADREDVGDRGLHVVVDDDAAVDVQPGFVRQVDVGPDAGGDHDQIRFEAAVVGERDAFDMSVAEHRRRRPPEQHADAEVLHLPEQIVTAVRIELPLHQRRHQVHDGDLASLHLKAARGLEAEQPAADHHGPRLRARPPHQLARVVERAEHEHAVLVEPFDRRHPRAAAGRQQQRVVGRDAAVVAGDRLGGSVDVDDAHPDAEIDPCF